MSTPTQRSQVSDTRRPPAPVAFAGVPGLPDATDLILSTWRDERRASRKPNPEVVKAIADRAAAWRPTVPVAESYQSEFRRRLTKAPSSVRQAKHAGWALDLMLAWWIGDGHVPDPSHMLSAPHIRSFRDAMRQWGYSINTSNDYIPLLNMLGKFGNPMHMKEWAALGENATTKTAYALAYEEDEVHTFFLWAWAQPTVRLRDGLLGLLYLTLGVGLYPGPMTEVRGVDVRELDDGSVGVRRGTAWLRVRPRYAAGLLTLAGRVGEGFLVPGATGANKTSPLKADLVLPDDGPKLHVERLVATFRWWCGRHLGPDALVESGGINAIVHLADLYRHMKPPSRPVEIALSPLDDLQDGPWAPDWPARHHRDSDRGH